MNKGLRIRLHRLSMKLWKGGLVSGGNTDLGRDIGRCCGTFRECESRELEKNKNEFFIQLGGRDKEYFEKFSHKNLE